MSEIKVGDWVTLKAPLQVGHITKSGSVTAGNPSGSGRTLHAYIEDLVKVAPPEPDWANVPSGTRVEVRDAERDEWKRAVFVAYLPDEEEYQFVAKWCGPGNTPYGWRYCRLAGGRA